MAAAVKGVVGRDQAACGAGEADGGMLRRVGVEPEDVRKMPAFGRSEAVLARPSEKKHVSFATHIERTTAHHADTNYGYGNRNQNRNNFGKQPHPITATEYRSCVLC